MTIKKCVTAGFFNEGDSNAEHYSTFDLGQAAALVSLGFQIESFDKTNPRKVQFIFRWQENLEKAIDDYWADRLNVRARAMFDNMKMLKNRIYSS